MAVLNKTENKNQLGKLLKKHSLCPVPNQLNQNICGIGPSIHKF